MRDFFDAILTFIDSESLTDGEFNSLPSGLTEEYNVANYNALKDILQERESVSGQLKKLNAYFVSKGVDTLAPAYTPNSQIFIGSPL